MPAGGAATMNSTRAPGGSPMWSRHSTALSALPFVFRGDDAELLRGMLQDHGEIQVRDAAGIHHAPELALAGAHLERSRRIVGIGHGNVIDRQIFRGLAEAGAVVGRIAIAIDEHFRHHRLALRGRRVGIHQVLIANH
jgi:hypothetical protein